MFSRRPLTFKDIQIAEMNSDERLLSLLLGEQEITFIPFTQIQEKLNSGYRYQIEPDLKKWSTPENEIISLKGTGGLLLAEVKYNPQTNQIFPPK